jgi:hypothetical protein
VKGAFGPSSLPPCPMAWWPISWPLFWGMSTPWLGEGSGGGREKRNRRREEKINRRKGVKSFGTVEKRAAGGGKWREGTMWRETC